jgi:hypothetical protein
MATPPVECSEVDEPHPHIPARTKAITPPNNSDFHDLRPFSTMSSYELGLQNKIAVLAGLRPCERAFLANSPPSGLKSNIQVFDQGDLKFAVRPRGIAGRDLKDD